MVRPLTGTPGKRSEGRAPRSRCKTARAHAARRRTNHSTNEHGEFFVQTSSTPRLISRRHPLSIHHFTYCAMNQLSLTPQRCAATRSHCTMYHLPPKSPTKPTARTLLLSPVNSTSSATPTFESPQSPPLNKTRSFLDKPTSPPGEGFRTPPIRRTSRSFVELPVTAVYHSPRQRHSAKEFRSRAIHNDLLEPMSPQLPNMAANHVSPPPSPQPASPMRRSVQDFGGANVARAKRHSAREFATKARHNNMNRPPAEPLWHTTESVKRTSLTRATVARLRASFSFPVRREKKPAAVPRMRSFRRRLFNRAADIAELELNPANKVMAYMAAADAAVALGHLNSAEQHLRAAVANAGRDTAPYVKAECFALLGILAERRGRFDDAERYCKESLKLSGDVQSYVPIFVLGALYNRAGRLDEAHVVLQYGEKYRKFVVK